MMTLSLSRHTVAALGLVTVTKVDAAALERF